MQAAEVRDALAKLRSDKFQIEFAEEIARLDEHCLWLDAHYFGRHSLFSPKTAWLNQAAQDAARIFGLKRTVVAERMIKADLFIGGDQITDDEDIEWAYGPTDGKRADEIKMMEQYRQMHESTPAS